MTQQFIAGRSYAAAGNDGTVNGFTCPFAGGLQSWLSTEGPATVRVMRDTVWDGFTFARSVAPGSGISVAYYVRVNASTDTLIVTLDDTNYTGAASSVSVSLTEGDTVCVKRVATGGTPAAGDTLWSFMQTVNSVDESWYGWQENTARSTTRSCGPFNAQEDGWNIVVGNFLSLIPVAGDLTEYYIGDLSAAPGVGKSWEIAVYMGGGGLPTKQDGTGGTVDTVETIADAAVNVHWTGTLPLVATDLLAIRTTPSGSPTSTTMPGAVVFKASIPGQSIFCGGRNSANSGSSVTYSGKVGSSVGVWDTTESDVEHLGPQTPYTLSGLMVYLNAAPGAGTSHTISGRINALDPSNGPSVTIADTSQGPTSDTRSMQLQPGLRWALKSTPANSPNARNVYWGIGATVGSCSGGGQIVVEADPPDGEEFTGTLIDYRAWVELSFDDQIRQLGIDALNVLAGRTLPLVIEYGDIERHLSGRKSAYQMGSCVLRVDDSSRLLSTLEAAQATQYWYNREVTIYLASKATIEANGTPHVLMRGLWRGFSTSGLSASITVSDILGSEFSPFNLEREIPDRVIDVTTFGTTCPEASRGLPVPIIYGHHSDRALTSGNAVSSVVAGQPVAPLSAPTGVSVSLVSGTPTNGHNGRQYSYAVSFTVNGLHTEWSVVVAQPNTPTTVNQLSWNTPPAGTSEIHIARGWSPNFRHTFAYVSTNEHNPSYTGIFSLPANSTSFIDYWPDIEERSADSSDGVWTLSGALQNFVVYVYAERADGTFSAPGISNSISIAPILEGPSSSRVNPQRDITLTWSAYTGAVNYHLLVYMDWWANTSGTYSAYHIVPGTSTSYTVPVPPRGTVVSVSLPVVTAIPAGRIPTIHVGEEDIGGTLYQRLLVCGHAIQHIETIYEEVPSQTPQLPGTPPLPPVWQPIPVSVFGATWLAPGFAGWPFATTYRDLAGQWFTIIYTTLNPPPPTRVDLCAIEDVGDSSGNTIKASTRVVNHLFKNWFLPDANTSYRSGSWLSPKTFDNGDPVVNTQSLSDVETIQVARIGGEGYELAVYIGAFISLRDVLGRVYENANIRIGQNQHGQVFFWDLDEWQDTSSARVVTDVRDIVAETDIDRRLDEMANRWIFSWGYRPSDGSFDTPTDILDDTTAIANNRDVVAKGQREFFYVNHQASAYDVILRELIWGSEPPRYVRVTCTLRQVAVKIGDVIVVTDYQGVGAAGWNGRRLAVLGMIVRLGSLDEAPSVVLECVDIERILTDLVVRVPAGQLSFTGQTPSSLAIASIAGTLSFTGLAPTVIRT